MISPLPPPLQIHDFSPKSGPFEGGTNITITGINLGKRFEDIYDQVTVAGVPCKPIPESYIRTRQIVCEVDGPGTFDVSTGRGGGGGGSYDVRVERRSVDSGRVGSG